MLIRDLKEGVYRLEKPVKNPCLGAHGVRKDLTTFPVGYYLVQRFNKTTQGPVVEHINVRCVDQYPYLSMHTEIVDNQEPTTNKEDQRIAALVKHLVPDTSASGVVVEVTEIRHVQAQRLLLELANRGAITREQILEACESAIEAQDA